MSSHPSGRSCRGQATPLVAIGLLLAALLLVPMGLLARATIERAHAQSAADAAALAGAAAGENEARSIAAANGARLVSYETAGRDVEVTVVYGDRRATARAERREIIVRSRSRIGSRLAHGLEPKGSVDHDAEPGRGRS